MRRVRSALRLGLRAQAAAVLGLVAAASQSSAQAPPQPAPDQVYAGCTFGGGLAGQLATAVGAGSAISTDASNISFIVVYSLDNENNGQPVFDGESEGPIGFTGPVICRNASESGPVSIFTTTEDTRIPPTGTADLLAANEALVLQYGVASAEAIRARVCHTVKANVDCFVICDLFDICGTS